MKNDPERGNDESDRGGVTPRNVLTVPRGRSEVAVSQPYTPMGTIVCVTTPKPAPQTFLVAALPADILQAEFAELYAEDPTVKEEAIRAAEEMRDLPIDDLDREPPDVVKRRLQQIAGKVGRRAPPNPFHSPMLGKYSKKKSTVAKAEDPALEKNPLRGRLIVTLSVNAALFMVFCQALILNRLQTGSYYASRAENSNIGPSGLTLYDLGGLNADAVRRGESIRIFWAMWMHSGWLHISLNVICQVQYFYMLEPDWGIARTLLTFWIAGLTGNMLSSVADPCKTTVGSSGGLFGLMGAVVPYCIEFWHSIPRPMCILIFSVITVLVTLATGLSASTDTWAHVGGLIGGLLFGFGTLTSPAAFFPKERILKKQVKKNGVLRWFQTQLVPDCKCGIREWAIRLGSWTLLAIMWTICALFLFVKYNYKPPGSLTWHGITDCCCCYYWDGTPGTDGPRDIKHWTCNLCSADLLSINESWGDYCRAQMKGL